MMITSSNPKWQSTVRAMRWLCPLGAIAAAVLTYLNWTHGQYALMAITVSCGVVCAALTWVQWRVFKI